MHEQPPFVREVVEWTSTLTIVGIQLLKLPSAHVVLAILSKNGSELLVHLQGFSGEGNKPRSTENLNLKAARQVTVWEDLWRTKQPGTPKPARRR